MNLMRTAKTNTKSVTPLKSMLESGPVKVYVQRPCGHIKGTSVERNLFTEIIIAHR